MKPDILHITEALRASWCPETSTLGDDLPVDNPARGHCVVSSLVVQDFLGGDLFRVRVSGDGIDERHYYNVLDDGIVIDTTREQYQGRPVSLVPEPVDLEGKNTLQFVKNLLIMKTLGDGMKCCVGWWAIF